MKVKTTLVAVSGDPSMEGTIFKMDTIRYKGKKWLVSSWLVSPDEGWSTPKRIICLDRLNYQKAGSQFETAGVDYVLSAPIPKAVLDGEIPPELKHEYLVEDRPPVKHRIGNQMH